MASTVHGLIIMSTTTDSPWYDGVECVICDEPLDHTDYPEDSEYIGEYGGGSLYEALDDDVLGHMCLYCREQWDSHANTLVVSDHRGRVTKVQYDDGILFDEAHFDRDLEPVPELPDEIEAAVLSIVEDTGWVSTDAWRGYTSLPDDADEYVKAKGGWHSSITRTDASDRVNELLDGRYHSHVEYYLDEDDDSDSDVINVDDVESRDGERLDFPVIGVFSTTSNVMSTGVDLYVPEDREDAIAQLFEDVSSGYDGSL